MAARTETHMAYEAATSRLRQAFPKEFATFYDEERAARGLKPLSERRTARVRELEAQLAALRAKMGEEP